MTFSNINLKLFAAILTTSALTIANASHNKVSLGTVQVAGSGCLNGNVSTRLDRTTGHFIVAPENYAAIIENGATISRKTCTFAIPFEAPANRAVRIRKPRIVGAVALDQSAKATINYEIFFAGQRGNTEVLSFVGLPQILESDFDHSTRDEVVYECGKSGIIRGNSSLLVQNIDGSAQVAFARIAKFGIKIDSVPCQ